MRHVCCRLGVDKFSALPALPFQDIQATDALEAANKPCFGSACVQDVIVTI